MHSILLEATIPEHWWEDGVNHTTIFLGLILTTLGIIIAYYKLRAQHKATVKAREEAVVARAKQQELLEIISTTVLTNNGGGTLLDKIEEGNRVLDEHVKDAAVYFKANDHAHEELKKATSEQARRIDGLYEIVIGGSSTLPRKTAQRHLNREEQNES